MNKIKTIIIDDEELARRVIKKHLEQHQDIEVVGECQDGFEGVKMIQTGKPDLIFLDIQMPRLTGFEMLELLERPPVIIFVTAYDQHAMKAFDVSAVDYLLKPFSAERFAESLQKARRLLDAPDMQQQTLKNIARHSPTPDEPLRRIVVQHHDRIVLIPVEKILRMEAQGDYVMLITADGKYLKNQTMNHFQKILPKDEFVRLHRSHLVRLSFIRTIESPRRGSYQVTLGDKSQLPVSRSGYRRFRDLTKGA